MTDSNYSLISGQAAQYLEIFLMPFVMFLEIPALFTFLSTSGQMCLQPRLKGYLVPLDILILILFNSLILSFKHFMADIMGQTVHQAMSDSVTDTAECTQ